MRHKSTFCPALIAFAFLFIPGCGSQGDGFSGPRGTVSGTVTIDGQPLTAGCRIGFISSTGGYTATGVIGENGTYTLDYVDGGGLPAGEYQIQFTAPIAVSTNAASVDPVKMASAMKLGAKMKAADAGPVPTKYQSTITSKMVFPVKDGQNTADFDLKKSE